MQSNLGSEIDRAKLNIEAKKGTKEQFDTDVREKLLGGTTKLNQMDNQLIDIEKKGKETADVMRMANNDLRNQRDVIQGVSDKNKNIAANLRAGKSQIRAINKAEFWHRVFLHAVVFILFITDVVLCCLWIKKIAGG